MQYKIENFKPLHDNVVVKPLKIEQKGEFVRPQQEEDKSEVGEVISMGGSVDAIQLKVGDIVLYNKYSTVKTDLGENLIVKFEDIVAVQK